MNEIKNRLGLPADARQEVVRRQIVEEIAKYGPGARLQVKSPETARIQQVMIELIRTHVIQRVVKEIIGTHSFMFADLGGPAEREIILAPGHGTPVSENAELKRYGLTRDDIARIPPEDVRHFVPAEKWTDIQTELGVFSDLRFWLHWCRSGKHWYYADYHKQSICMMDRCLRARTVRGPKHIDELLADNLG